MSNWSNKKIDDVLREFDVVPSMGLSEENVLTKREKYGLNQLPEKNKKSIFKIIWNQFSSFIILVLFVAALISGLLGEITDSIVIFVILLVNGIIGALQDYRSETSLAALSKILPEKTHCKRNGKYRDIPINQLVPGDIVRINAGDLIPADLRILTAHNLRIDESLLTGESQTVSKDASDDLKHQESLSDETNMCFKGTMANAGRAETVVTSTGIDSEIGKIADLLNNTVDSMTPLQLKLDRFGKKLTWNLLALCTLIFVIGVLQGHGMMVMLLTSISLAVAAIPEALPSVITIALSYGAKRLAEVKTLIQKLSSVEALGSITYICSDKTGTLTQNMMTVVETCSFDGDAQLWTAMLNNSDVTEDPISKNLVGEPTEVALYRFAKNKPIVALARNGEIPFDSKTKFMMTVHASESSGSLAILKGAPEVILPLCEESSREKALSTIKSFTVQGLRVLAFASKKTSVSPDETFKSGNFKLLGLCGLIDPPREGVSEALEKCRTAGIKTIMITGDHPDTAKAIAVQIGLWKNGSEVITGGQLAKLTKEELVDRLDAIKVYARTSPEQKIQIVKALQERNELVAMTGDGVNDAPALKQANVGVAMGLNGTEVARQAAQIVLLDDHFGTIVRSVEEGRRIYDNIRKFIQFSLLGNLGEVIAISLSIFTGLSTPFLPVHILWVNLITDGLPGLAFSFQQAEKDIMARPPRSPTESLLNRKSSKKIIFGGVCIGFLSMLAFSLGVSEGSIVGRTMAFTTLSISQLFVAISISSDRPILSFKGIAQNPMLNLALLTGLGLQILAVEVPVMNQWLGTAPLSLSLWLKCFGLTMVLFIALEVYKAVESKLGRAYVT